MVGDRDIILHKSNGMFNKDIYITRRQRLKKDLGSGIILLLGNEDTGMNYRDNCYPFRQDSSFLYFIGLDKPSLAAVINIDEDKEIIFGNEPTIDDIVWMGTQPSVAELAATTGITTVSPVSELETIIKKALASGQTIHFLPPYRLENFIKLSDLLNIPVNEVNEKASLKLIKAVVAQRAIKSAEEVSEINKAVNISNEMHLAAMRLTIEGVTESHVA